MRKPALWVSPKQVCLAKQMDLLTYLQTYEPQELVPLRGNVYATRTHDSLKISNGKWFRWSTGEGGKSALDYLIKVRGVPFQDAVLQICGLQYAMPPVSQKRVQKQEVSLPFVLPDAHCNNERVLAYLAGRGIASDLLNYCAQTKRLYESAPYHNCVFVGCDMAGTPKHAAMRSSSPNSNFKQEVEGSDKRYSFSLSPLTSTATVHVYESAIDMLSHLTLMRMDGRDIAASNYITLNGVYVPRKNISESVPPLALAQYLKDHPRIERIVPCLDNDVAGRGCGALIRAVYSEQYEVDLRYYPKEKDYNAELQKRLGIRQAERPPMER